MWSEGQIGENKSEMENAKGSYIRGRLREV